ncbi:hypothetical protein FOZ62_027588, partial [Perkinsus olseni]
SPDLASALESERRRADKLEREVARMMDETHRLRGSHSAAGGENPRAEYAEAELRQLREDFAVLMRREQLSAERTEGEIRRLHDALEAFEQGHKPDLARIIDQERERAARAEAEVGRLREELRRHEVTRASAEIGHGTSRSEVSVSEQADAECLDIAPALDAERRRAERAEAEVLQLIEDLRAVQAGGSCPLGPILDDERHRAENAEMEVCRLQRELCELRNLNLSSGQPEGFDMVLHLQQHIQVLRNDLDRALRDRYEASRNLEDLLSFMLDSRLTSAHSFLNKRVNFSDNKENSRDRNTARALLKSWVDVQDESAKLEVGPKSSRWPTDTGALHDDQTRRPDRTPQHDRPSRIIKRHGIAKLSELCVARGTDDRDAALAVRVLQRLSNPAAQPMGKSSTKIHSRDPKAIPVFDDTVYSMEARRRDREVKRRVSVNARQSTQGPLQAMAPPELTSEINASQDTTLDDRRILEIARAQVRRELEELRGRREAEAKALTASFTRGGRQTLGRTTKHRVEVRAECRRRMRSPTAPSNGRASWIPARRDPVNERDERQYARWQRTVENLVSTISLWEQRQGRILVRKGFKELLRATVDWKLLTAKTRGMQSRLVKGKRFHAWLNETRSIMWHRMERAREELRVTDMARWHASQVLRRVWRRWRTVAAQRLVASEIICAGALIMIAPLRVHEPGQLHARVAAALSRRPEVSPSPRELEGVRVSNRPTSGSTEHTTPRKSSREEGAPRRKRKYSAEEASQAVPPFTAETPVTLCPVIFRVPTVRRKATPLRTPPEVLRMYERAQHSRCSKLSREERRAEQHRMTIADEASRETNEEWRRHEHMKLRRLRRQAIGRNRAVIMDKLRLAGSSWARATLRKGLGGFIEAVEERRFRELKADRWYLTVIRLKSIKAFTMWSEDFRRLSAVASKFEKENILRHVLTMLKEAAAAAREDRVRCCTFAIRHSRSLRMTRAWLRVATEAHKAKCRTAGARARGCMLRKAIDSWKALPSIECFEREVEARKSELWNKSLLCVFSGVTGPVILEEAFLGEWDLQQREGFVQR